MFLLIRFLGAAWRRPLEVTGLGAFGPKPLLLPPSAQNTPPGCICGVVDCRASASSFLFLSQKERKQRKMLPPERCGKDFAPAGATRAPPWTHSPDGAMPLRVLRTWAAPNMGYAQPFEKGGPKLYTLRYAVVFVGSAWSLNGVLSKAQNRLLQPGKGRYYLPPITTSDSRHNPSPGTTVRRGAPGRVCLRVLTRRLLLLPTPGAT